MIFGIPTVFVYIVAVAVVAFVLWLFLLGP
jgi:hypothetical protein